MSWSERFDRYLPLLVDVPGYRGIRIHAGNTERDTDGCILVGQEGDFMITQSRVTLSKLIARMSKVEKKEKIWIVINR